MFYVSVSSSHSLISACMSVRFVTKTFLFLLSYRYSATEDWKVCWQDRKLRCNLQMFTLHYFCGLQARVPLLVLLAILKDFDLRTLKCKPQTLLLKYKLIGLCPVQIGSVQVEKRNSNRSLYTKIFLDPCAAVYLGNGWTDLNATCTKLIATNFAVQMSWCCICRKH